MGPGTILSMSRNRVNTWSETRPGLMQRAMLCLVPSQLLVLQCCRPAHGCRAKSCLRPTLLLLRLLLLLPPPLLLVCGLLMAAVHTRMGLHPGNALLERTMHTLLRGAMHVFK